MNKTDQSILDAKGLFLAFSDLTTNDEDFVNDTLREEGRDPKALEEKGKQIFHKHFLNQQLANESSKKTSLVNQLIGQVATFLNENSASISSTLLPGKSGSQQQMLNLLCNKFKDFSPEDLNSIMQDEVILKELEKIQQLKSWFSVETQDQPLEKF